MKKIVFACCMVGTIANSSLSAAGLGSAIKLWKKIEQEFYQAINRNRIEALTKLLDEYPGLRKNLSTGLIKAVMAENKDIVKLLLERGADANIADEERSTALIHASFQGNSEIAELLLKNGADVNAQNKWGNTALILAIGNAHREVAMLLIENNADVNIQNEIGRTALIFAADRIDSDMVNLLLKKGADMSVRALALATTNQDKKTIEFLNHVQFIESMIASSDFHTPQAQQLLGVINTKKSNDELFQLLLQRTIFLLKKYETNTIEYRNAAQVLYAFARRIAQDYIRVYGFLDVHGDDEKKHFLRLSNELEIPLFVGSYDPALVNLYIISKSGEAERFVLLVEEMIDRIDQKEQGQRVDDLIQGKISCTSARAERILHVINRAPSNARALQIILRKTLAGLHENKAQSTEYRNAAKILYTFARRIAQDYIKSLGTKTFRVGKVLPRELEVPIFLASYNHALVNLHITNSGGQDESFAHIIEENIDRLMPK